jgi:hypothetical protein
MRTSDSSYEYRYAGKEKGLEKIRVSTALELKQTQKPTSKNTSDNPITKK